MPASAASNSVEYSLKLQGKPSADAALHSSKSSASASRPWDWCVGPGQERVERCAMGVEPIAQASGRTHRPQGCENGHDIAREPLGLRTPRFADADRLMGVAVKAAVRAAANARSSLSRVLSGMARKMPSSSARAASWRSARLRPRRADGWAMSA